MSEDLYSGPDREQPLGRSRRQFMVASAAGAGGLAAFLSACGSGGSGAASASKGTPALGTKKDQKYYWVTANLSDPFYQDGINGMKQFGKLFGVDTAVVGPQKADVAGMTQAFEETIQKPDCSGVLSYYYADFKAAKPLYEEAAQKNIPIVNASGDWGPPRLSFVGVHDQDAPAAALALIDSKVGSGKVGYIGNSGANVLREEKWYERLIAQSYPKLQFAGHAIHDGSADDALKQYRSFIESHQDVQVMFFGDGLGPSIVNGLIDAAPNVKLVLRGFGKNGLQAIQQGKVLGTVDRMPYDEEFWGFVALYFAVNGNLRAPDSMLIDTITVSKDNVAKFMRHPYQNIDANYSARA